MIETKFYVVTQERGGLRDVIHKKRRDKWLYNGLYDWKTDIRQFSRPKRDAKLRAVSKFYWFVEQNIKKVVHVFYK